MQRDAPESIQPHSATLDPRDGASMRVRSVWISDLHLGTPGCRADALLDFLKHVDCDHLFLVGDIIDGWQLKRSWYWPQAHNDVVQKLLRKARKGTRVVFVPGNHDEFARRYLQHNFGGIEVAEDWVHVTADGRRLQRRRLGGKPDGAGGACRRPAGNCRLVEAQRQSPSDIKRYAKSTADRRGGMAVSAGRKPYWRGTIASSNYDFDG